MSVVMHLYRTNGRLTAKPRDVWHSCSVVEVVGKLLQLSSERGCNGEEAVFEHVM